MLTVTSLSGSIIRLKEKGTDFSVPGFDSLGIAVTSDQQL